jgi:replicative DNA helicase
VNAERSLLGALLIRGRLDAVPPELRPDDFDDARNRKIYRVMLHLEAEEQLVDTVMVYGYLTGDLAEKTYLASLLDGVPNPDEEGIRAYSRIVMEEAAKRRRRGWAA